MNLGRKDPTAVVVGGGWGMGLAARGAWRRTARASPSLDAPRPVLFDAASALAECGHPDIVELVADITDPVQVQT